MKTKRKFLCLALLCAALLPVLSCMPVTTTPFIYTNSTNTKFEILGEVLYESSTRTGYTELLKAARKLYPDCDYVIDIMIDQKEITVKFPFVESLKTVKSVIWIMRGTAIKYTTITQSEGYR